MIHSPVVILSGKRRSGKDFTTEQLLARLKADGINTCVLRLSEPIKRGYAKEQNLDFSRLMMTTEYKETYRTQMIKWGEDRRNQDAYVFCREIASSDEAKAASLWIVSDARRPSDLQYFIDNCKRERTILVRVSASDEVRRSRGWVFTAGADDVDSECALDSWNEWDFCLENNNDLKAFESQLDLLYSAVKQLTKLS